MGQEVVVRPWWDIHALAGAEAARFRRNALLLSGTPSLYWPSEKRDTDSHLWPYAVACLEAALRRSGVAVASYAELVGAYDLRGCQDFLSTCKKIWPSTDTWLQAMRRAYTARTAAPQIPGMAEAFSQYKDNPDFNTLIVAAAQFVLLAFNRMHDVREQRYKVLPGLQSFNLTKAVAMRSMIDHAKFDAAKMHHYGSPDIERIMTAKPWPGPRRERQIREQIISTYQSSDFKLKSDDALLNLGEMWYEARVLRHTLREAADGYGMDANDLSKRIRPCDDATGYPYHR